MREGPAGLITTTTQVSLHPENETRLLSLTTDDSPEQTKRVIMAVAGRDRPAPRPTIDEWHTLQHWLEDGPRRPLPFALARRVIPPIATRLRRDVGTVLALVQAHALLHRAGRESAAAGLSRRSRTTARCASWSPLISDTLGKSVSPASRAVVAAVAE